MNIEELMDRVSKIPEPKTTSAKHKLAKELVDMYFQSRKQSEIFKWFEGLLLYKAKKFGLHNYFNGKTSLVSFYEEDLDTPATTAHQRLSMWDFYILKHKLDPLQLWNADTYKLTRAMTHLKDATTERIKEVVEMAERGKMPRIDFLREIGILT